MKQLGDIDVNPKWPNRLRIKKIIEEIFDLERRREEIQDDMDDEAGSCERYDQLHALDEIEEDLRVLHRCLADAREGR